MTFESLTVHLVESTAVAIGISALIYTLRHSSASLRYTLWFMAAAKFVAPCAAFTLLGSAVQSFLPGKWTVLSTSAGVSSLPSKLPVDMHVAGYSSPIPVLFAIWLCGSLVAIVVWLSRFPRSGQQLEHAPASQQVLLDELRYRLGVTQSVAIKYCQTGEHNLGVWGFLHPEIRMPRNLDVQLTKDELEAVLVHELAHVRRHDNLLGAFLHLVVCLFWFHPLLWWIERNLTLERERACDEMVVQAGAVPETYVSGVLKVCRFQLGFAVAGISGMSRSNLRNRMEIIMSNRPIVSSRLYVFLPATLAALFTLVPFGSGLLRADGTEGNQKGACVYDSIRYPQGTVMQMGSIVRQCGAGSWEPTSKPPKVFATYKPHAACDVQSSVSAHACRCQDGDYSLGALTQNTNHEFIRCDKFEIGKFTTWRPALPSETSNH